ncbi:MAG: hypothetical protein M1368_04870 [Thaumarchaeota archaeon]|nr:hypothetical protein [Nitrososphaerota archaeon]
MLLISFVVAMLIAFVFFVPLVQIPAVPPSFVRERCAPSPTNQSTTICGVASPPIHEAFASITYCFFGTGGLAIDGTYFPFAVAQIHLSGSSACPM